MPLRSFFQLTFEVPADVLPVEVLLELLRELVQLRLPPAGPVVDAHVHLGHLGAQLDVLQADGVLADPLGASCGLALVDVHAEVDVALLRVRVRLLGEAVAGLVKVVSEFSRLISDKAVLLRFAAVS